MKKNIFEYIIKDTEHNFNFRKYKLLKKRFNNWRNWNARSYFISFFYYFKAIIKQKIIIL